MVKTFIIPATILLYFRSAFCFISSNFYFSLLSDGCQRLTQSLAYKRLSFSSIYPLFVNRFRRSLRFRHLEFDNEIISEG